MIDRHSKPPLHKINRSKGRFLFDLKYYTVYTAYHQLRNIAMKEYQKRAAKKYSNKCKQVSMKLNLENDKHREAYAILKDQKNKQDYIIDLIINANK